MISYTTKPGEMGIECPIAVVSSVGAGNLRSPGEEPAPYVILTFDHDKLGEASIAIDLEDATFLQDAINSILEKVNPPKGSQN